MTNRDMLDDISNDGDIKCNYCIYKYDDNHCTGGCADFTWLNTMIDDEGNAPANGVNDERKTKITYCNHLKKNWKVAGHSILDFFEHFLHGLCPLIHWKH